METSTSLPYSEDILSTEKLSSGYSAKHSERVVSSDLDLKIKNGELVALLGPNGCGKSTLMRTIAGLQPSLKGNIIIDKKPLKGIKSKDRARLLSLVLTEKVEAINLTVWDIISIGRYPYVGNMGKLSDTDKRIVFDSLEACSLEGFENRQFSELSDGEKQKVMIARALAQDTPLMLLDEPTAHLDLPNRIDTMRMLYELAKKTGKGILVSTHELDLAMQWADTIWLMDRQGEVYTGVPEDLVLEGQLSAIFGSKHAYFDIETGVFKINRKPIQKIRVIGSGAESTWIKRALERKGFGLTNDKDCNCSIEIMDKQFHLSMDNKLTTYSSIAELLLQLQTPSYWKQIIRNLI